MFSLSHVGIYVRILFDAEESINAQAFVMVMEEELKELGLSFGGRKILKKLMEEIRLQ